MALQKVELPLLPKHGIVFPQGFMKSLTLDTFIYLFIFLCLLNNTAYLKKIGHSQFPTVSLLGLSPIKVTSINQGG